MLFGKKVSPVPAPVSTVTQVRQIMARMLRRSADSVRPCDSFASLTGGSTVDLAGCHFDDNYLDLLALEMAIKESFQLDITEEENEKLFRPGTTAQQFADFIDGRHRT